MNAFTRKWGEHIVRSRQYAAGVALMAAFISCFGVPIGWLSSVIIGLVTLQNGPKNGLIVLSWAILPAVALLYLGQYAIVINVIFLHFLLAWFFAAMLARTRSWITSLQVSAAIGMLGVITIYYLMPDLPNYLITQMAPFTAEYKKMMIFQASDIDSVMKYISLFAPGLLALATILANFFVVFIARWWQATFNPGINLQKECYYLRMPYIASFALIALSLGLYLNNNLFVNLLVVALLPFALSGLSLLHAYFGNKKNGVVYLAVVYGLFIFLTPYMIMFLTMMGWLDSFLHFRKKFLLEEAVEE